MSLEHWQEQYGSRGPDELSWFQAEPALSLSLIEACRLAPEDPIVDVGGGASVLVDRLLTRGYRHVTVLDLAQAALDRASRRLGQQAEQVRWIAADVTRWEPDGSYALWHDRAVFHFLVDPPARSAYLRTLERALRPGGHVVMATFSPRGPERCSGLPVVRYSAQELQEAFGPGFTLLESLLEEHRTPAGKVQEFLWVRFRLDPEATD